ncbi:MAG: DNA polymerase III subunit alpha [Bacteroidales bacterium]|nr:DNA polymerase III subunit alpha [Bacteroidales bacterium]
MARFTHLHVHTEYSTLDGASKIPALVDKAVADGMTALAVTDHGNMFGIKEFFDYVQGKNKKLAAETGEGETPKHVKPIFGCEVYVAVRGRFCKDKNVPEDRSGHHLILLAKNKTGYHNLVKLVSKGYIEGLYYKPRIDKELLQQYHEGLIVSSACIAGEVPSLILAGRMEEAREAVQWFKTCFGDDYYLELQRHKTDDPEAATDVYPQQEIVNEALVALARECGIKLIATNDVHFVNQEDAEAHERLLCVSTQTIITDPKRLRYTKQEWFKTQDEMAQIFADVPEALANTMEIAAKVEEYSLDHAPIMPDFPIPEGFADDADYLRHLTYQGAEKRYSEMTPELKERLDFELDTIIKMGFPGYFLIVQDFINAARELGVSVGPGRGSAAGSVVAYCLRITDIDPLKYDLLFERFLNPDRISLPDIDVDLDDEGRADVLRWLAKRYGSDRIAHIITFGTMATKMAIADVARVENLPLSESDRLKKLVPERAIVDGGKEYKITLKNCVEHVPAMRAEADSENKLIADTLKYATMLEGTVRGTGLHACGIIIGKDDLTEFAPLCTVKDGKEDVLVTQYEGKYVESVGLIKMDLLGLSTLSQMREALRNIELTTGKKLDLSAIPLDDEKTFELFRRGDTTGTFQFESDGMKKHLRNLRPSRFEDLIAMNALYRPGPMDYIPSFIARKAGREAITYDLPAMEKRLKETYGITVYQEQLMLLSRDLAGFTRGQSDELRKAMGKKKLDLMEKLKVKFFEGCERNGYGPKETIEKIWNDWVKFAKYAFNKSHATCYTYIAYQTAYLKAHYPSEFMAAILSRNLSNITEISKFMDECRRMGIQVLGPDINESNLTFTVNSNGDIRFGLGAIKGVGAAVVESITKERQANGLFKDIYDFVERVNLNVLTRRTLDALAEAGAFDSFPGVQREQFFVTNSRDESFSDILLRYGSMHQESKWTYSNSLFGDMSEIEVAKPELPFAESWSLLEKLNREKNLVGMYLSAHPLDDYRVDIDNFTNLHLDALNRHEQLFLREDTETPFSQKDFDRIPPREFAVAGIVSNIHNGQSKRNNKPYCKVTLEDYSGSYAFFLSGSNYENYLSYMTMGQVLLVKGDIARRKVFLSSKTPTPEELERVKAQQREAVINIKSIQFLANVRDEVSVIEISIPLETLQETTLQQFKSLMLEQPRRKGHGKPVTLQFRIYDEQEKIQLGFFSRTVKVIPDNDLLLALSSIPDVQVRLHRPDVAGSSAKR